MPRILIVESTTLSKGLATLLQPQWEVCGEASDGQEAIEKVLELKPDLVILDLSMPLMGGTAAAREIRRLSPQTKIVFLSMHDSETIIDLTRLAGADACVSKRRPHEELLTAIAAALRVAHKPSSLRLFDATFYVPV